MKIYNYIYMSESIRCLTEVENNSAIACLLNVLSGVLLPLHFSLK